MANCGRVRCKSKSHCKCNYQAEREFKMMNRIQVSEETRNTVNKCWFIDGNDADGYRVINGKGEDVSGYHDAISPVADLANLQVIVRQHNQKVMAGSI